MMMMRQGKYLLSVPCYDSPHCCAKCGGRNEVTSKDSTGGTMTEGETTCTRCGHSEVIYENEDDE